jgi:FemAB-related protein (PEP-CTERM system-associated)
MTSPEVRVEPLDDASMALWDRFVEATPEATFFHRAGWRTVVERSLGHTCHFLQARRGGVITGVLPLVHLSSRLFGNRLISPPYGVYGGPVASDEGSLDALNRAAERLAEDLQVGYLEYRLRRPSLRPWTRNSALYATFRKPLAPDPDAIWRAVPRKRRAMIRKANARGLESELDHDIGRFYPVYAESIRNLGTPVYAPACYRALLEVFRSDCEIVTVVRGRRPLASVLCFYFRDEVLPYHGANTPEGRRCAASDFMYWEVMRRACARGARVFDFGRSKLGTGSFAYKRIWGFEPANLHHEYLLLRTSEMPDLNPLNPKYAVLVALWRRLPLFVANTLGPSIARGLG